MNSGAAFFADLHALVRAAGAVNLRRVPVAVDAGRICADLLSRVQSRTPRQNPPEPDDQGVLASFTKGQRRPAGGASATQSNLETRNKMDEKTVSKLTGLMREWSFQAAKRMADAKLETDPMGRRLIEHGATCLFNCAQAIRLTVLSEHVGQIASDLAREVVQQDAKAAVREIQAIKQICETAHAMAFSVATSFPAAQLARLHQAVCALVAEGDARAGAKESINPWPQGPIPATNLQSYIDNGRNSLNDCFNTAWAGLMAQALGHTTMAQHHQWAQDAKQLVDDRVAGLQWQDDAYSDDPVRMDNLYSQYHLFELNPKLRKAHQDRSAAEPR